MDELLRLVDNPRVTVRRPGPPDPAGTCVVYWMQRAQRGVDNPALEVAIAAANRLRLPLVEAEGEDFVPCFTSVQRLTTWAEDAEADARTPSPAAR